MIPHNYGVLATNRGLIYDRIMEYCADRGLRQFSARNTVADSSYKHLYPMDSQIDRSFDSTYLFGNLSGSEEFISQPVNRHEFLDCICMGNKFDQVIFDFRGRR